MDAAEREDPAGLRCARLSHDRMERLFYFENNLNIWQRPTYAKSTAKRFRSASEQ